MYRLVPTKIAKLFMAATYLGSLLVAHFFHKHPEHSCGLSSAWITGAGPGDCQLSHSRVPAWAPFPICDTFGSSPVPNADLGSTAFSNTRRQWGESRRQPVISSGYCPNCEFLGAKWVVSGHEIDLVVSRTGLHYIPLAEVQVIRAHLPTQRIRAPPHTELF